MSLEHKSTNYHYSKKKLENKSYNVNFIILEYHFFLRKHFLHGKSVSWKRLSLFFFENLFLKKMYLLLKKTFLTYLRNAFENIFEKKHFKNTLEKRFSENIWKQFLFTYFLLFFNVSALFQRTDFLFLFFERTVFGKTIKKIFLFFEKQFIKKKKKFY